MTAWERYHPALAPQAVNFDDTQGKAVIVLSSFVPSSGSTDGSDRRPVLPIRFGWAKVMKTM